MAEDNDVIESRLIFCFGKGAPEVRGHPQQVEIIRRNRRSGKRLRLALGGQTDRPILVRGGGVREHVVRFAPCKIIWGRHRIRIGQEPSRGINGSNHRDAIWLVYYRTSQQKSADKTEHRGIHGNAQRQSDNHSNCKSGILE